MHVVWVCVHIGVGVLCMHIVCVHVCGVGVLCVHVVCILCVCVVCARSVCAVCTCTVHVWVGGVYAVVSLPLGRVTF